MRSMENGEKLQEATRHLKQKAQMAGAAIQDLVSKETAREFRDVLDVRDRVEEYPYRTIAAALGVGYVLGGGLFSPVTRTIVSMGLRIGLGLTALPLLKEYFSGQGRSRMRSPQQGMKSGQSWQSSSRTGEETASPSEASRTDSLSSQGLGASGTSGTTYGGPQNARSTASGSSASSGSQAGSQGTDRADKGEDEKGTQGTTNRKEKKQ